jgi:hypothetical protein
MKLLLPAAALVLALAACASGRPANPHVSPHVATTKQPRPSVKAIAAARERAAGRQAAALLRRLVLPAHAAASRPPHGYGGVLRQAGPTPAAKVVDRHRFWTIRAPLASVEAFVTEHRPRGFRFGSSGRTGDSANEELSFVAAGRTHWLNVTVVGLPGRTVVRADALVVWDYPRSPHEQVPAGVSEIDVEAPKVSRTVTDPATVARIVHWFDALPITPPGIAVMCPLEIGQTITLSFVSAGGAVLAKATLPSRRAWICDTIDFWIGKRRQTPLVDSLRGPGFVSRLGSLLGVKLDATR